MPGKLLVLDSAGFPFLVLDLPPSPPVTLLLDLTQTETLLSPDITVARDHFQHIPQRLIAVIAPFFFSSVWWTGVRLIFPGRISARTPFHEVTALCWGYLGTGHARVQPFILLPGHIKPGTLSLRPGVKVRVMSPLSCPISRSPSCLDGTILCSTPSRSIKHNPAHQLVQFKANRIS